MKPRRAAWTLLRQSGTLTTIAGMTISTFSQAALAANTGPIAQTTTQMTLSGWASANPGVSLSPDRTLAYVVTDGTKSGHLTTINLTTSTAAGAVSIPRQAGSPVVSADGTRIFMTSPGGLAVIDPKAGRLVRTMPSLRDASDPVVGPLGKHVYVVDEMRGHLLTLDAQTLKRIRSTPFCAMDFADVGPGPEDDAPIDTGLSITPDGRTVLVGCYMSGLQRFSSSSGKRLGSITKVTDEGSATFSPDGTRAYFAEGTAVSSVDLRSGALIARKDIYRPEDGRRGAIIDSWTPAITPDGSTLYVPWRSNGTLKAIDTRTLAARTITLDGRRDWGAIQAVVSPAGTRLYVLTPQQVVTIDPSTGTVIGVDQAVPQGAEAQAMAVSGSTVLVIWNASADGPAHGGVSLLNMSNGQ
jgi:DNA-binding beta-propeller fold protein YncE